MKFQPFVMVPVATACLVSTPFVTVADASPTDDIRSATQTFEYVISDPDKRIPPWILRRCAGIVIGEMTQAGFIFGGKGGGGVMLVKNDVGTWSNPAFVKFSGGSFGLQIGAASTDFVVVFMDKASLTKVLTEDFAMGGDIKGVGGPVGAAPVTAADSAGRTYTYARREGLFAGVALEGAKLSYQGKKNGEFYNQPGVTAEEIFTWQATPSSPQAVKALKDALRRAER